MKSMTGYGKASCRENDIEFTVEIKAVNNRYLDINCKIPKLLNPLEDELRKTISSYISRGRVDVYVNLNDMRQRDLNVLVDMNLAKGYFNVAKMISGQLNITNDITVSKIFDIPDIVKLEDDQTDYKLYAQILTKSAVMAIEQLNNMREAEGEIIKKDILQKIGVLKGITQNISEKAPVMINNLREKLKQRICDALENVEIDEARLLNEVAVYTDKYNIDEELLRLTSHYKQLEQILNASGANGKQLDFLIQELNREANTICSKSGDIDITNFALQLKTEIEKIREQVQNIE